MKPESIFHSSIIKHRQGIKFNKSKSTNKIDLILEYKKQCAKTSNIQGCIDDFPNIKPAKLRYNHVQGKQIVTQLYPDTSFKFKAATVKNNRVSTIMTH